MEVPELADLIWLFEDDPTPEYPDLDWPVGLWSFRLRRNDHEVLFSLDPMSNEAYITMYVAGQEIAHLGRLRQLDTLSIINRPINEGLTLRFVGDKFDPLTLETKPIIRLTWNAWPLGTW
jgi:hypothetical protein